MRITIVAVGVRMPSWVNQGVREYTKRFPPGIHLKLTEIPSTRRHKSVGPEKSLKQEAERIRSAIPKGSHVIILDEHGKTQRTLALAKNMALWMQQGKNITFVIGGADGLHKDMKTGGDELWKLSALTLPHGLARVLLMEQLYRAWSVINKHPYHRE